MNIKQILEYGVKILKDNNVEEAFLKTKILLCYILDVPKEYLIVHDNEKILGEAESKFNNYIDRLVKNEPIQYIIGKQEFMGLEVIVNENVLIPRPDTEILVEEVIDIAKKEKKTKILDLCTGSGAIGISIANNIENCEMTLADISTYALEVATKNSQKIVGAAISRPQNDDKECMNKQIKIIQSDLFENIEDKFPIIVSNPPYIKSDVIKTLDKEVQNEPILALDGGKDGLDIYRKIIGQAYKFLKEDGYLCLEIGYDQKEAVIELIKKTNKYKDIYSKKDLAGNDRIVICKKEN